MHSTVISQTIRAVWKSRVQPHCLIERNPGSAGREKLNSDVIRCDWREVVLIPGVDGIDDQNKERITHRLIFFQKSELSASTSDSVLIVSPKGWRSQTSVQPHGRFES